MSHEHIGPDPDPDWESRNTYVLLPLPNQKIIPEQFTVKAHPALFEGRGEEEEPKNEGLLFQPTIDIHILKIPVYSWHTLSKRATAAL